MPKRLLEFGIMHALSFYRRWVSVLIGSSALLGLIGYASDESVGLFYISFAAAVFMVTAFHILFGGGSAFFNVIFANMITIYLCLFTFFIESLFQGLPPRYIALGFLMPLAAFLAGAIFRKGEIQKVIQSQVYLEEKRFIHSFLWLIPIAAVGVLGFMLHQHQSPDAMPDLKEYFLGETAIICVIVFLAAADFTLMLLDTGMLFGHFFRDNIKLIKPAFSFFIFYSMNIIIFAGIYKTICHLSDVHHFIVRGVARDLTFIESLYFSLITLSTLGYGDIVPTTNAIRLIVSAQTFSGTLLFLFGVHAILGHGWDDYTKKE